MLLMTNVRWLGLLIQRVQDLHSMLHRLLLEKDHQNHGRVMQRTFCRIMIVLERSRFLE